MKDSNTKDSIIELGLRDFGSSGALATALRATVDDLLARIHDLVAALDVPATGALREQIAQIRSRLVTETDPRAVGRLREECLDACRTLQAEVEVQNSDRQREVASLIALVREAMFAISGDTTSFHDNLGQSIERFEALRRINNLHEMQTRLASEVMALKQVAAARRKTWDTRFASFGQRIAALEDQLTATRCEATTDPLTRLPNRAAFDRACKELTKSARQQFVVASIEMDDLGRINDAYGHSVGDRLLAAAADVLRAAMQSDEDLVARCRSAQFAFLATNLTPLQAEPRFRATLSKLATTGVQGPGDTAITATFSCGIAEGSAGDTSESLIERADQALVDAKRQKKDRIAVKSKPFVRDLLRR